MILVGGGIAVAVSFIDKGKNGVVSSPSVVAPATPAVSTDPTDSLPPALTESKSDKIIGGTTIVDAIVEGKDASSLEPKAKVVPKRFAPKSVTSDCEEWYSLAKNYHAAGRHDLASEYLKKVIASDDPRWVPQARELLKKVAVSLDE